VSHPCDTNPVPLSQTQSCCSGAKFFMHKHCKALQILVVTVSICYNDAEVYQDIYLCNGILYMHLAMQNYTM